MSSYQEKFKDVILEDDISNWECCFNCAFAYKIRKETYGCKIRTQLRRQDPTLPKDYNRVKTPNTCEYFFRRPPFGAETYGYRVILYYPQEEGVKKFMFTKEYSKACEEVEEICKNLKAKNIRPLLGFKWSFSSSRTYALTRNRIINGLWKESHGKYKCGNCGKLKKYANIQVHHIRERTKSGSHTTANLKILCYYCHSLETWKLMTKNDEIPLWIRWRKAIEAGSHRCEEEWKWKWGDSRWTESRLKKEIIHYKSLTIEEIKRMQRRTEKSLKEIQLWIDKRIQKLREELQQIYEKSQNLQKRRAFWKKYDKLTAEWRKKEKRRPQSKPLKNFYKIDDFLK